MYFEVIFVTGARSVPRSMVCFWMPHCSVLFIEKTVFALLYCLCFSLVLVNCVCTDLFLNFLFCSPDQFALSLLLHCLDFFCLYT